MQIGKEQPRQLRSPRFVRVSAPPFQITSRDQDILRAVGRYRLIQSDHLDLLFPEASEQKMRRRLRLLFHDGYLARPRAQIASMIDRQGSKSIAYTLTPRGAQFLAALDGTTYRPKAGDTKLLQLEHALEITDFIVRHEAACRGSEFLELVSFEDLLAGAPEATRRQSSPDAWRVNVRHEGARHTLSIRPDAIFAIRHRELAARGKPASKFFFLEADRGTMPIMRPRLYQTSIFRKFLAYAETFRAGAHKAHFGMDNMRVLFVVKNRARLENMIEALSEHAAQVASPRLFLFADRETLLAQTGSIFEHEWFDGEGKEHTLFE
jgi:hypothetical protein